MFERIRQQGRSAARSAAMLGVAGAMVGGGMALAGEDGGSGEGAEGTPDWVEAVDVDADAQLLPPPPPIAALGDPGDLTYAEFHVQRDGEAVVIRSDAGEVVSADEHSITVAENDGNEVSIPVDEETLVLADPGEDGSVSDLSPGDQVIVDGPKGEAADSICEAADTICLTPEPGDVMIAPAHGPFGEEVGHVEALPPGAGVQGFAVPGSAPGPDGGRG